MNMDTAIDTFFLIVQGRALLVAALFYVGCATLDLNWSKTLTICGLVYFLHICSFGSRRLEQVGLLILAIGVVSWIDLLPVKDMVANMKVRAATAVASVANGH
jgi:hypothetical protein